MAGKEYFTTEEARQTGEQLGIDWSRFDVEQFRMGLDVELEHGLVDMETNVTGDDFITTGKIALAHLKEVADYYTRLEKLEREAERELLIPGFPFPLRLLFTVYKTSDQVDL